MPSTTFTVETYTVVTSQSGTASSGSWRVLTLTSPDLAHGIRNRASVYFFETPPAPGTVTNVDQPNLNGLSIYAYARKEDFTTWYDLLRNEKPMSFVCAYDGPNFDPSQPTRSLYWFQLFTGQQEPPGEGPEGAATALRIVALERALGTSEAARLGTSAARA